MTTWATEEMVHRELERNGYVYVSQSVMNPLSAIHFAMNNNYGLLIEPKSLLRREPIMICKEETSKVITGLVDENRKLRARILQLEDQGKDAGKGAAK